MKLVLVGDVMLGRLVNDVLTDKPPEYPWGDTLPLFQGSDWCACNLECVLSDCGSPWERYPKRFHFRSDQKNVAVLQAAGIHALSLANNHTLDYEYEALFSMLNTLDCAGIQHSGAGENIATASQAAIRMVKGVQIGLIAFTDNEAGWEATQTCPGIFYVPIDLQDHRAERLLNIVRQVKERVDLLIVSAHWGPNWGSTPPMEHVVFGRALIEAGADVVFGHSAHICQGVELYWGRPILYSTGNFIDDYAVDPIQRNDRSCIFVIETDGKRMRNLGMYPTVIYDFQARRAHGIEAQQIVETMTRLCSALETPVDWCSREGCLLVDIAAAAP